MTTITKIKKHNSEVGFTFFDKDRMKLIQGKALDKVYCGNDNILLILSCRHYLSNAYHICQYQPKTGFVGRLIGTMPYMKLDDAKSFILTLTKSTTTNKPPTRKKTTSKPKTKKPPTRKKTTSKPKTKKPPTRKKSLKSPTSKGEK